MKLGLLILTAAMALTLVVAGSAAAAATPLAGTDGPGFTIVLMKGGKQVKTLKPGKYALAVNDKSASHNFHIFGPGLNKVVTTIAFVGKNNVTFTLKKGTYTYQCDAHAAEGMKGTFKVS
jgi:plastocyanin